VPKRAKSRRRVKKHKRHYITTPEEQASICTLYRGDATHSPLSSTAIAKYLASDYDIDISARTILYILKRHNVQRRERGCFQDAATYGKRVGQKGVIVPRKPVRRFAFDFGSGGL
jgi:hypothetical protein